MPGTQPWGWVALGLAVPALVCWVVLLARRRSPGAAVRLAGTVALVVAGLAGGERAPLGGGFAEIARLVAGALVGYLVGHTAGFVLDRVRRRGLRDGVLTRDRAGGESEYRLRTVLLPSATATGVVLGFSGAGGVLGVLVLAALVLLRREFVGAPLVALVITAVVVVLPLGVLRSRSLRDVALTLSDDEVELAHRRRGGAWRRHRVPLAAVRSVTVFADPYGRGRMLRVDGGRAGRFEVRAVPGLSGRGAPDVVARAARDLLGRPGWRPATGRRPYPARWGTRRYRATARENGSP